MKNILKETIFIIPIIMLLVCFISSFVDLNPIFWGNLLGHSILTDIVFLYIFFYGKYCFFTKMSIIGLFLINTVDLIGCFIEYGQYHKIFNITIFAVVITLVLIYKLKIDNDIFAKHRNP